MLIRYPYANAQTRCPATTYSEHLPFFMESNMLETVIAILLILWLLGMVSSYSLGGALHLLLVVALIVIVIRVLQRRRL